MDKTDIKKENTPFHNAEIRHEGTFVTPQGDQVLSVYVDLSGRLRTDSLCIVKASEPKFALSTSQSIRLSRPGVFRNTGEVLVKDKQEGRVRTSTSKTTEVPTEESDLHRERTNAVNVALELCRSKISINQTSNTKRTNSTCSENTFGKDWLIYCTSICPMKDQELEWKRTFPDSYTSVSNIYRPTQFAQGLGLGVSEHIGVCGKSEPARANFHGFKTIEVNRKTQFVIHGPVLYVDDPYRCINEAKTGWQSLCAMTFVKSHNYALQREYRFALLSIKTDVGDVFDLPISGILRDCLVPITVRENSSENGGEAISIDDSSNHKTKMTSRGYTYKRRIRRSKHEMSRWNKDKDVKDQASEEVFEQTVKSPIEIPDPFPKQEESHPDVILYQLSGRSIHYTYNAYRDVETKHWRIETVQGNSVTGDESAERVRPESFKLPSSVLLEPLEEHPVDPRLILNMCLNPSIPKPPIPYEGFSRFNKSEIYHALACSWSLGMAVNLLKGTEQARAAASAWYAFRFVLDLVALFGPIVKSVCIIRECVAVVELKRSPMSDSVAWATISGTGTYTLYIDDGITEDLVFKGQLSQEGSISPGAYTDALQQRGWLRKI